MNATYWIIAIAVIVVLAIALLIPALSRKNRTNKLQTQFGTEYDHTVQSAGSEKKAQTELEERQTYVKTLDIRPLTLSERERYLGDWAAVQSKFVDEPGQAILDADRLIMEVMQLRNYPVSDFDQRAADISVSYPTLVSNYRSGRAIAVKNEQLQANTEELRQAMIFYRSLFEELLGNDGNLIEEK
jgi:cytoskeletal protein RodZ